MTSNLKENDQQLNKACDLNQLTKVLINQVEEVVDFIVINKIPYTAKQISNATYTLIFKTGLYNSYCKDQYEKLEANKSQNEFKYFFIAAS